MNRRYGKYELQQCLSECSKVMSGPYRVSHAEKDPKIKHTKCGMASFALMMK